MRSAAATDGRPSSAAKLTRPAGCPTQSGAAALALEPTQPTTAPNAHRITALGGGHGLAVVLKGLVKKKRISNPAGNEEFPQLTAIVTISDDGGSSGVLRRALNIHAVGDLRNCLLALSSGDSTLRELFDFRFKAGLDRHSLGNLILAALTLLEKDVGNAVERACKLLAVQGQVIPASTENIELLAEFDDGGMIKGESKINADERRVRRLSLLPADVPASQSALDAIAESDLIVIGPGSIYTSLIPVLLLDGIVQAIVQSGAQVVLVMNLMTEVNETRDYSATDIVKAIRDHAPNLPIHTILVNNDDLPPATLEQYKARGSSPVSVSAPVLQTRNGAVISRSLLARGRKIRHDPQKLADALLALMNERSPEWTASGITTNGAVPLPRAGVADAQPH